jgi:hypothetical protein
MRYEIELTSESKAEIESRIEKALQLATNDMVNDMVEHCPVKTGFTRNTITGEVQGNTIILTAGGVMVYIEFGTPPHDIKPDEKKALYWEGAEHPVKVVHHPGTMPNPIMSNAIHRGLLEYLPKRLTEVFAWAG